MQLCVVQFGRLASWWFGTLNSPILFDANNRIAYNINDNGTYAADSTSTTLHAVFLIFFTLTLVSNICSNLRSTQYSNVVEEWIRPRPLSRRVEGGIMNPNIQFAVMNVDVWRNINWAWIFKISAPQWAGYFARTSFRNWYYFFAAQKLIFGQSVPWCVQVDCTISSRAAQRDYRSPWNVVRTLEAFARYFVRRKIIVMANDIKL